MMTHPLPTTDLTVTPRFAAVEISAVTRIDAPIERAWTVLTDTEAWSRWNPLVRSLDGALAVGERLTVELHLEGRKPQTFRPAVTDVVPGTSFEWLGRLGVPGLFDGRHRFELRRLDARSCELVHSERLAGGLVPAFKKMLTGVTPRGFVAMNEAFAAEVLARAD